MNDAFLYGSIVAGGLCAVLAFVAFHTYSGVKDSLENAEVGRVYNFEYHQPAKGEPERFFAKVVGVQKFSDSDIARMNAHYRYRRDDANFVRTRNLVTARSCDGKIRNFYAERTGNVRRPLLGNLIYSSGIAKILM